MRFFIMIVSLSITLMADFFPKTINTTVSSVNGDSLTLTSKLPAGMSAIVIHSYGNDLQSITAVIKQSSDNEAKIIDKELITHENLPTPKTKITAGDKVIGGYLYNNVLILAPNADIYNDITSNYSKNWIHPDEFALYLSSIKESTPTKTNLKEFAKQQQAGLVLIVKKNSIVLYDPMSEKIVSQKAFTSNSTFTQAPFYMRLNEIKTGLFGGEYKGGYYELMENFQ
ncbi:MAG: plasminogen-binding N-terminal domain-containing protein [Campylobacterales bacterium]|nr:plasminogen-binding N-terminal domain-containing protein [Campylobacterales bacterium]